MDPLVPTMARLKFARVAGIRVNTRTSTATFNYFISYLYNF